MQLEKGAREKKLGTRLLMITGVICAFFCLSIIGGLASFHTADGLSAMDRGQFHRVAGILLLCLVAVLAMAGLTASFILSSIRKPMEAVIKGIEEFERGNLTPAIRLNRSDEWSLIENALNAMASRIHENIIHRQQTEDFFGINDWRPGFDAVKRCGR